MVEYTTEELFGNSAAPGFSGAEVFGNTAQPPSVPPNGGGLSSAEVFGPSGTASSVPSVVPPTTTPLANASAPPTGVMSSAEVYGQRPPTATADTSSHWSATRGLVSGFAKDYPQLAGETLEGLSHFAPEHFKQPLRSGADYLRSIASEPAGYERIAPELKNVKGINDALTWAGETFGQGTASTAAPIALGVAGFAAGGVPGAVAGGVAGGSFQNYGEVYKALKDAGVEPERAAKLSAMVLPIISGLDVAGLVPASKLLMGGAKEAVKQGLVKMVAKEAGKSAAAEGVTEGVQEGVKQATISAETGKPLLTTENAWAILENALGGALVGGPFGAGSAAVAHKGEAGAKTAADLGRPPSPEEVQQAFADYKPGQSFSDPQLEVLRKMVAERPTLEPEGGNFAPSVQSAMASTQEGAAGAMGPGPLWYDKAEEAAQSLPESGTAQQMRNTLINKGVRLDNLTWTGLDEFFHSKGANIQATPETVLEQTTGGPSAVLALENWKAENWGNLTQGQKKPTPPAEMLNAANAERADLRKRQGEQARLQTGGEKVTKQDILNHLRENRYTLKEQIRDDITSPITPQERAMQEEQTRLGERLDELNRILDDDSRTIHGGERGIGGERIPLLEEWNQTYLRLNEVSRILNDNNVKRPSPEYSGFVAPGERRGYATLSIQVPANERAGDVMSETPNRYSEEEIRRARGYRQPHFTGEGYQNTIAFATITLREDTSGQMTAHIEQIQSDWQQLARTQGYISKALIEQEVAALKLQDETYNAFVALVPLTKGLYVSDFDSQLRMTLDHANLAGGAPVMTVLDRIRNKYGQAAHDVALKYADAYYKRLQISRKINKAVADAPYKMTQDWTRLMLRRILRWAADKGIQRVTWNNPELAWQYPTGSAGAAQTDVSKMDAETRRRWEGIKKHYGQTIPSVAKELARQYGGDIGITQIKTSQVGPWVARPFVANGVVTGWGVGRWEGQNDVFGQTNPFHPQNEQVRALGITQRTYPSEAEAQAAIDKMKAARLVNDAQITKFSNQVMYLDFDRRAQWNFQTKGFPSFMLNPNIEPAAQPKAGSFDVYEDTSLRNLPIRTPLQEAAYRFADALGNIQKQFGFKGDFELVLYGTEKIRYAGSPLALHTYEFDSKKHTIEVALSEIENMKINGAPASDAFKVAQLWSTMMHEFGHAVMWEKYDQLPASTKLAIQAAYDKFITDTEGMKTLGQRMQQRMTAIGFLMSDSRWAAKDWNALPQAEREYWAGFDEWFAEQVARWGTIVDRPLSVVEKALKGISDMLKAVFDMMTKKLGLNLRPEKVMEDWLNSFLTTEQGFGHQQSLNNDAQTVKSDQIAIRSEEPDMYVPVRSAQADTIKQSAMSATHGATPAGVTSSAVHASRFNFMYKYMGNLAHLAEANPFFAPLTRYVERIRRMHLDETNIHDAAVRIRKDWRDLQGQSENLVAFINDLVNLDFLTPAEKAAGVIRQPNPIEQNVLVTKHKLSAAGLKVFQKIKILNDWVLDLTAQSAIKSATRIYSTLASAPTLINKIDEINARVLALKQRPFFPFMRFGRNFVIQKDTAGNTVHFETFERIGLKSAERQQNNRVEDLRRQFPGYPDPEVGVLPEAAAPFVGMPPMLLEEIRNKLTLTPSQNEALENLMYNHSTATKFPRAFKQNYIKGYSMDFQRSFARYFFYAGRYYARAEHAWELNDDIRAARLVGGNTAANIANFMSDHLKNTVLEAKGDFGILKGGIFLWAMGYVPAAATQNLTQTPMITFPYLAGKFGDIKATRAMANAMRQMSTFYRRGRYEKTGNRELEALDYGVKHGIITESQASELAAASQGMNLLKGIGGGAVARNWQAFMEKSAWMFEMAEQWNRRIAYRAAYNLALESPNADIVKEAINAYRGEFNSLASKYGDRQYAAAIITASYATTKTQYDYSRAFRPRFMRGRLPGTLFVFKTYMANTLWMLANNKSDVLPRFLIISALMGGLAGIPGYEDLRDILKALGHWMNKDFNVEHALRQFVNSHFDGKVPPDMIIGGMARRGYGIPALLDLLGSFATGIPGRGFDGKQQGQNVPFPVLDRHRAITLGPLLPVELGKVFDPTDDINRTIAEQSQRASGAVFSVGFNIYKAIMDNKLAATDPKRWERAIPRELGDLTRTWRAFSEGRERSRGGVQSAPTIAEFNWRDSEQAAEMLAMATGYQPLRVQAKWDQIMAQVEVQKFYEMQQKTLFGQLFEARKGANQGEIESVLESIRRFNRELPSIARGYTITQENAKASIMGRERELIARERGIPTQKRNVPISRYVNELFPETTVDVRRVR